MKAACLVVFFGLLAAACKSDKTPANEEASPSSLGAEAAPKPIDEAEARTVFNRWLAAQNGGDFSAYEVLFATSFSGVKTGREENVQLRSRTLAQRSPSDVRKADEGRRDGRYFRGVDRQNCGRIHASMVVGNLQRRRVSSA